MRWSFKIARIAGIDVRIHVFFLVMLAFFALNNYQSGGAPAAAEGAALTCLVFLCVLLHEFGHALAARRYGIRTPDITLLPIGGLARLERMPENPVEELVVALAGPAVNVGIAALLLPFAYHHLNAEGLETMGGALVPNLFFINLALVVFNLIPAFPMDGGRVLRAFLAMRLSYARATAIAAGIGQILAVAGGMWGLMNGHQMLVLIAVFVFFGAQNEAAHVQTRNLFSGLRVRSAMITDFHTLPLHSTLNEAIEALLSSWQHDFPVVDPQGAVRGLLTRDDLIVALRQSGAETPVAEAMRVEVPSVHPTMLFDRAMTVLQESGCPALPVLDSAGALVGLFTPENAGELLSVRRALGRSPASRVSAQRIESPPSVPVLEPPPLPVAPLPTAPLNPEISET